MKIHVKDFLKFWNFSQADYINCWYPQCSNKAVDIAHIMPKGMGGRKSAEFIENYIPLCRKCHEITEGKVLGQQLLYGVIVNKILKNNQNHDWSDYFKKTWYYQYFIKNDKERIRD